MFQKTNQNFQRRQPVKSQREHAINEEIGHRTVRVINAEGGQVGVMDTGRALDLAADAGADLVLIVPNAQPPVCRIVDYGKFIYDEQKRKKEADRLKRSARVEVKEFQFRPQIDMHDLEIKIKKMREVISDGNKCKIIITFRGRENHDTTRGRDLIELIASKIANSTLEARPELNSNKMTAIISPNTKKSAN